jgi:inosine-uridine nucleoside N-ribohydrolase
LPLAVCATFLGCAGARPIILTTDVGTEVDDQWALAYLLLAADGGHIDLRGVVATHAPTLAPPAAESSAAVAREVLEVVAPRASPPILAGESTPLRPDKRPRGGPGARFIVEQSRGFDAERRLAVLAIGAATDVAEALLFDPGIAERIEVIAMGFNRWPEGGDPWNVKNDPRAYEVILDSSVPLTIACADVCIAHLTLDEGKAERVTRGGGKAGAYLAGKLKAWLEREAKLCETITGRRAWPIWDVLTVAALLGMTEDEERPRPRLRPDLGFDLEAPRGTLRWIKTVDEQRVWDDFRARLGRRPAAP